MKKLAVVATILVLFICYCMFTSGMDVILTLPSKPLATRLMEQWKKMITFVSTQVTAIKEKIYERAAQIRMYVELDIMLPLYIWWHGLARTQ